MWLNNDYTTLESGKRDPAIEENKRPFGRVDATQLNAMADDDG